MPRKTRPFVAYEIHPTSDMPIVTAPVDRGWMDATGRYAYRCLPLVLANQAGWLLLNPCRFTVRWNGGARLADLRIRFGNRPPDPRVMSHFGHGVLTFSIPYLFRTPRGVNLWVKGASNWIKDGAQPLEGIVESDWSAATFTMNWKITRRNAPVRFDAGEPIAMLVPIPRGLSEGLEPVRRPLRENRDLERKYAAWQKSRGKFLHDLQARDPDATRRGWQRDYFLGFDPQGAVFKGHQTRMNLKEFR